MTTWLGTDAAGMGAPRDLRLVAPAVATWGTALPLLNAPPSSSLIVALITGCAALLLLPFVRHGTAAEMATAPVVAVLACACAAALVVGARVTMVRVSPVAVLAEDEGRAAFTAVITRDPRPRSGLPRPGRAEYVIEARTTWVRVGRDRVPTRVPVVILASGAEWRRLVPSQRVRASGVFLGTNDALTAALVPVRGPPEEIAPPSTAHAVAGLARERLRGASESLPHPERGLLPALLVGDTSELRPETAEHFRATGMTHLLTVSGSNLAIMTGVVIGLSRRLHGPTWCTVLGGAAMIAVFVLLARPEPSVVRAAFMGAIALLALALGRRHTGLAALSATVIGLLLFDPALAGSYGFALSVLATGGILLLAPRWTRTWSQRMPRPLAEAVAVALAAHVACAPVLVLLSEEVSWVAIPANVAAAPLVGAATVLGLCVAAIALVSPLAAAVVIGVPGLAVAWIAAVAEAGARVPHGTVPWRPDVTGALVLAALIALALLLRGWARRIAAVVAVAIGGTVALVQCVAPSWPPPGWAVVTCDVGQGDAVVLDAGDGTAVLVDTGEEAGAVDDCLDRLGIREVSLLILTHDHADHVDAAPAVARGRSVRAALAPPGFADSTVGRTLRAQGVPLHAGVAGRTLRSGLWRLDVLGPRDGAIGNLNDRSVVVRAERAPAPGSGEVPVSVLLSGDIEESAQLSLLSSGPALDVDVLKTPHHGSAAQDPAFLRATRPVITLTSVGADNTYGHPAPATMRRLEALTAANYRTDLHGDIAVITGPDGLAVVCERRCGTTEQDT
ncbi:ComEC/Rec2 family competence protein [Nocardiopsis rhodophaea]|uniref:ComEC/Rec2 family competence protein n=1 Tax=Nocardiopsis rhodophaea TaxID=280238 RepID=UPI0031E0AFAB